VNVNNIVDYLGCKLKKYFDKVNNDSEKIFTLKKLKRENSSYYTSEGIEYSN